MFRTRLLSGIVLVIVLVATVGTGGELLFAFIGAISLVGMTELYKVVGNSEPVQGRRDRIENYGGGRCFYCLCRCCRSHGRNNGGLCAGWDGTGTDGDPVHPVLCDGQQGSLNRSCGRSPVRDILRGR